MRPCDFCGVMFDHDLLGKYGCPSCFGEGVKKYFQNYFSATGAMPMRLLTVDNCDLETGHLTMWYTCGTMMR